MSLELVWAVLLLGYCVGTVIGLGVGRVLK